jgi:hypothetical protein
VKRFYVAADYARKAEVDSLARTIEALKGWESATGWAHRPPAFEDAGIGIESDQAQPGFYEGAQAAARADWEDLSRSSIFIQLTTGEKARGGRHVELGMALAIQLGLERAGVQTRRRRIIACGPRENVFHWLPQVELYDDVETMLEKL